MEIGDAPIGESWEVSAIPNSVSVIANGECVGRTLTSIIEHYPEEILGSTVCRKYGGQLPLLVKFIDAKQDLSIQVHPNDEMAQREHGKRGKSEMWFIIDAAPDSYLYAGFKDEITPEKYKELIANGTITEVLAKHEVHPGDVFYLPAGRVHAIGTGILLAEIQQSSDVTYRIYDYNRAGLDGNPRELHTELASRALNFHVEKEYRTSYEDLNNKSNLVISSPFFTAKLTTCDKPFHRNMLKYDSFVINMCIEGSCQIHNRKIGDTITLSKGNSCLIPASIADYDIIPIGGKVKALETFINNRSNPLTRITHFIMRK